MEMQIEFPGGKRVNSDYKGFIVKTDQPKNEGGDDSAPEPYDLFLSSIGTCAGVYIVYFCESRDIPTDEITMTLRFDRNEKTHLMEKIAIDIHLPSDFPKKYRKAVIRSAQMCTVKQNLIHPPEILVTTNSVNG
ncbi:MAG: OsmC family protein [Desulfosarcina sp.]|nr:OsmC family protein [Desulfosarcina sp.]MBC2743118.1 OsmC family protein [Desulfosarcina sp.]MBC2766028.1 osmotically inducible protein OsmC [Desulfosarcina sp.]